MKLNGSQRKEVNDWLFNLTKENDLNPEHTKSALNVLWGQIEISNEEYNRIKTELNTQISDAKNLRRQEIIDSAAKEGGSVTWTE